MSIAGNIVDYILWGMMAGSYSLIIYKSLDFWAPKLIGRASMEERASKPTLSEIDESMEDLEGNLHLLGISTSTAPFVGLAGTVIHIVAALKNMQSAGLDISIISGPIATALTATLVGLAVALPSMIAYSLFVRKLQLVQNKAYRKINFTSGDTKPWPPESADH